MTWLPRNLSWSIGSNGFLETSLLHCIGLNNLLKRCIEDLIMNHKCITRSLREVALLSCLNTQYLYDSKFSWMKRCAAFSWRFYVLCHIVVFLFSFDQSQKSQGSCWQEGEKVWTGKSDHLPKIIMRWHRLCGSEVQDDLCALKSYKWRLENLLLDE